MWKKIVVTGGLAVAALGVGGVAWASSGPSAAAAPAAAVAAPTTGTTAPSAAAGRHEHHHRGAELGRGKAFDHGVWTTQGKDGKPVTHDAVHGDVTAVSGSSITVKAADGTSMTFAVTADTKVRVAGAGKDQKSTIADVKVGEKAVVGGTGTSSLTATRVLDLKSGAKTTTTG
jgi:hypothetical protein